MHSNQWDQRLKIPITEFARTHIDRINLSKSANISFNIDIQTNMEREKNWNPIYFYLSLVKRAKLNLFTFYFLYPIF